MSCELCLTWAQTKQQLGRDPYGDCRPSELQLFVGRLDRPFPIGLRFPVKMAERNESESVSETAHAPGHDGRLSVILRFDSRSRYSSLVLNIDMLSIRCLKL